MIDINKNLEDFNIFYEAMTKDVIDALIINGFIGIKHEIRDYLSSLFFKHQEEIKTLTSQIVLLETEKKLVDKNK